MCQYCGPRDIQFNIERTTIIPKIADRPFASRLWQGASLAQVIKEQDKKEVSEEDLAMASVLWLLKQNRLESCSVEQAITMQSLFVLLSMDKNDHLDDVRFDDPWDGNKMILKDLDISVPAFVMMDMHENDELELAQPMNREQRRKMKKTNK